MFVWALADPDRVPQAAWKYLRDPHWPLRISIVSVWELTIKAALGRIKLPCSVLKFVAEGCRRTETDLMGIGLAHIDELEQLPHHHRDPFDRMLVAQARADGLELLSFDAALDAYDVERAR